MLGKWSWQPSHFERHSKAGIRIYKWEQFCRTSSKAVCRKRTDKHTNTHAHTHTQTHKHTHTHTHTLVHTQRNRVITSSLSPSLPLSIITSSLSPSLSLHHYYLR